MEDKQPDSTGQIDPNTNEPLHTNKSNTFQDTLTKISDQNSDTNAKVGTQNANSNMDNTSNKKMENEQQNKDTALKTEKEVTMDNKHKKAEAEKQVLEQNSVQVSSNKDTVSSKNEAVLEHASLLDKSDITSGQTIDKTNDPPAVPLSEMSKTETDTKDKKLEQNKNTLANTETTTVVNMENLNLNKDSVQIRENAKTEVNKDSNNTEEQTTGADKNTGKEPNQKTVNTGNDSRDDNVNFSQVTSGTCTFGDLPPLPKKVVRIFISSTFTDTQAERNALMQRVYPKLSDYCREKHGLEFQVVDMRWGVPEAASDNHSTSQLCLQEIKKCKEVSVGPNFVALLGDKYGYRPIPSDIDQKVFQSLQQAAMSAGDLDWSVVEDWYKLDHNAIPPVYILQPISSKLQHYNDKENQELHRESQDKWNQINRSLTSALRSTAVKAHQSGTISATEKEPFFVSVTEQEIAEGVLIKPKQSKETSYCIIRKIEDIDQHVSHPKAYRYTDLTPTKSFDEEARNLLKELENEKLLKSLPDSNLLKIDIEWLISGANITLQNVENPAKTEDNSNEKNKIKHEDYINRVCDNFFKTLSNLIEDGCNKQKHLYSSLTTELLQHWHLAKTRCEVFEGREDELKQIKDYLLQKDDVNYPLIVHGNSGCGKTSIMAKVIESISEKQWPNCEQCVIIPRFLGTTPDTSNLHQLLVSLCSHLCCISNLKWEEPEKLKDLIEKFHSLLQNINKEKTIVLLLDSVDQLMPAYNAFKLKWLPEKLPPNAKILVSTIDDGYTIYQSFQEKYAKARFVDVKVTSLGGKLGLQVISKWLSKDNRTMTGQQEVIIKELLAKCSLPLYARIAYDQIKRWKSYDIPESQSVEPTVRGAINKLFSSMEEKFGVPIVRHSLSYLTASRHGMSEAELEHVLSLDDLLLNDIFKLWMPPVRRVPPLLWTRVRTEIHSYIVERSADDVLVLNWYHRQFIEATKSRYLSEAPFSTHVHDHLVQFFTGKWGGGRDKPFEYTDAQVKRFGLKVCKDAKDRKVPKQPYMVEYKEKGRVKLRFNKRKLSEVPFQLIKTKNYEALKSNVFFNFDWLYAKLQSSSVQQLLEEFEIFMQGNKVMNKDSEIKVLYANFQLMRPYLHKYPDSLPYEITGRLAKYIGSSSNITSLIKECDSKGVRNCPIMPMLTSFETANIGFSQNIKFRTSDSWVEGGAVCCSEDFQTMYILDYSDDGSPLLLVYDIDSGEKTNTLNIIKPDEGTTDMYSKIVISLTKKEIFAFYRQAPEGKVQKKSREKYGLIDMIDIETGNVINTFEGFILNKYLVNPLLYMTENVICLGFMDKVPFINIRTGVKKELNKPTLLDGTEEYFIVCDRDKTNLRQFKNKQQLAEFDVTEPQMAVNGTADFSLVIMVESKTYTIRLYNIKSKISHLGLTSETAATSHLIKCKKLVPVNDDKMKKALDVLFNSERGTSNTERAHVIISPNQDSFTVIYGERNWIAHLYSLNASSWNVKYIGQINPEVMIFTDRYPVYSDNGTNIIVVKENVVNIISCQTGESIHKYTLNEPVRDFAVSQSSNKLAVMFSKSVLMLTIPEKDDNLQLQAKQQKRDMGQQERKNDSNSVINEHKEERIRSIINDNDKSITTLLYQMTNNGQTQPEMVLKHSVDHYILEEVHKLAAYADTDRIASARSKRKHAVYKTFTPNGLHTIHYHSKVQVVDTKNDAILYTPKKGDTIVRTVMKENNAVNETIQIPGLDVAGSRIIEMGLQDGDRIVHEGNKIRLRVSQDSSQVKIMNVPSLISIYSVNESKLRKIQSITVFKESILVVSDNYMVTSKDTTHGHFLNIYKQLDGKLIATHQVKCSAQCARFSTDEAQLFVVDSGLCLTGYIGPLFNSLEIKVPLVQEPTQMYSVKEIHLFDLNRDFLVVHYGTDNTNVSVEKKCVSIDLTTRTVSKEMVVTPSFEDISEKGLFGIDASLQVYDLKQGDVKFQLTHNLFCQSVQDKSTWQVVARFCGDQLIVIINKQENTLHLISIENELKHLFSCFCHLSNMLPNNGISVVNYGQNLILRSQSDIKCFAIMPVFPSGPRLWYNDERSRALSMMLSWCENNKTPQVSSWERESVFVRRKLLIQQMNEENKLEEKPIEKEFQKENPDKPQVLIISESILSTYFVPSQFSKYLKTEKISAISAEVAANKINNLSTKYDVIILQLITDDVTKNDITSCVIHVCRAVECARSKARMVLLSLAPSRGDGQEINKKTQEVNEKLSEKYKSVKDVLICTNSNLSNNGKPIDKYFQDGVTLSSAGVKQISVNYKDVLLPILAEHYWVGQKKNPNLQTSGNKII